EIYEKLLDALMDNASLMIKAIDQLGVERIGKNTWLKRCGY
ncbi:20369_t:CDS:2, partial [Gigaspora rosea]